MIRLWKRAALCTLVIGMVSSGARPARAKDNASSTKAEKSTGGWEDEIKGREEKNPLNPIAEAPPEKGGQKTRQAMCRLRVDNHTPWTVQIGVEGRYNGTVAAWGDAFGAYSGGTLRVFGVAEFVDGSALTWGPTIVRCYGAYAWTLEQP
jgi:hypothetical protein